VLLALLLYLELLPCVALPYAQYYLTGTHCPPFSLSGSLPPPLVQPDFQSKCQAVEGITQKENIEGKEGN